MRQEELASEFQSYLCVSLGQSLNLIESQFPYLQVGRGLECGDICLPLEGKCWRNLSFGGSSEVPEWSAGDLSAEGHAVTSPSPRQFPSSSQIYPTVHSFSPNVSKVKGLSDPLGQFD